MKKIMLFTRINEKKMLNVESSNPNFQNFEFRMGDNV